MSSQSTVPESLKSEYPFKGKFHALSDGYNMHYLDEGEGRPIVMLHGNPTWSFMYRNVVKRMSGNFRCIVPDHLGCGLSDKPQDFAYTLENRIRHVEELLETLEIESFDLIVHDWGGAIGMGVATRNPQRVGRIVITNTAAFTSNVIPFRIGLCRWPLLGSIIVRGFNGFAWPATFMAVRKKLSKIVKQGFLLPYDNWKNRVAVNAFVKDIPMSTNHESYQTMKGIESKLQRFSSNQIKLIWGAKDFCFSEHFLSRWQDHYPEAKTKLYPDADHYLFEDAGEDALDEIACFLKKCQGVSLNSK